MTMRYWARARFNLECKLYVEVSRVGLVSQGFGAAKSRSADLGADGGALLQQFVLGGERRRDFERARSTFPRAVFPAG